MKKILSVLLAVAFCIGACALAGSAADRPKAGDFEAGDTFDFGWYPQKRVSDNATIEKLNAFKRDEVELDGATYRALRLETQSIPGGAGSHFAAVYGYAANETYWFSFSPITWRVLENDKTDGTVLLMADQILDAHAFNTTIKADNTWGSSDLRTYLNDTFLNTAFSAKEQRYMINAAYVNAANPLRGTYNGKASYYNGDTYGGYPFVGTTSGSTTLDRVSLPSFADITNKAFGFNKNYTWIGDYGEDVNYYVDGAGSGRQATATDYAECSGVWTKTNDADNAPANEFRRYWLRTAGEDSIHSAGVLEDGRVSITGWPVNYTVLGLRPVIRVQADAMADRRIWINVNFPEGALRYRNPTVQLTANENVVWSTSDESIATIDENGLLTVHDVGYVNITATLADDPDTSVTGTVEVRYAWWQWIIRIVLLGWIWY